MKLLLSGRSEFFFLEPFEVGDGTVLDYCPVGYLVGLDFGERGNFVPDFGELLKFTHFLGEEQPEIVDDLVDGKIEHRQIAEVVIICNALLLVQFHEMGDLPLVELVHFLDPVQLLLGSGGPRVADESEDCVLEVALGPEIVDFHPVLEGLAEQLPLAGDLDDVSDHCVVAGDNEVSVFNERQVLDDPAAGLPLLEAHPVVGVEEAIIVWQMQVLADQPQHLRLGSKGIVADDDRHRRVLSLHLLTSHQCYIVIALLRCIRCYLQNFKNKNAALYSPTRKSRERAPLSLPFG